MATRAAVVRLGGKFAPKFDRSQGRKHRMSVVLVIDDEVFHTQNYVEALKDRGLNVVTARTGAEARVLLSAEDHRIGLVVTDIMMVGGAGEDDVVNHGGYRTGLVLARWIKDKYPSLPVVALTNARSADVKQWFRERADGYFLKASFDPFEFAECIAAMLGAPAEGPRVFIVHGHDEEAKYALKNYLQNTLKLPEPVVLHEQPNCGRTILEKFEEQAGNVDVVFVLLTPDDTVWSADQTTSAPRRARQNVIFELGYFLGRMGRGTGRVLLLHRGALDLPSDIAGLVYIDISEGIEAAGESIRRELSAVLGDKRRTDG